MGLAADQEQDGERERDKVHGNLIMINPNGGWSWYQDERAIVDRENGKLVIGSVANRFGFGGDPKDGDVEATLFDLETGGRETAVLRAGLVSYGGGDDHNLPGFLQLENGDYLAIYAGHNNNNLTWHRTYDTDTGEWGEEGVFDWDTIPGGTNFPVTYSNIYYLSAEDTIYNIARTHDRSPNIMISTDQGESWTFGGQITRSANVGYVNGYFKYATNGVDRIDFIATEHHPRDFNNSIYHGYIRSGKSFDSNGVEIDGDLTDRERIPSPEDFTLVFAADTVVDGVTMTRAWNLDVQSYDDGSIATLFKARANDLDTDHRFFYARFDGEEWSWIELAKAGAKLFHREEDYTGLGALDPNDPRTLYISTPIHPTTDAELGNHEIFKGVTADRGRTWTWSAVTENSSYNNVRPVIPAWDEENTAVFWLRGTMTTSQNYDQAIVGILDRRNERNGTMQYLDARPDNTAFADGAPLELVGGEAGESMAANRGWRERADVGNGGSVFTTGGGNDGGACVEEASLLRTTGSVEEAGDYDVWVLYWATPARDWRIAAGLDFEMMATFRIRGSQRVDSENLAALPVREGEDDIYLYQGYLGRVSLDAGESFDVFIAGDDGAAEDGSQRTWYDGVGYSKVKTRQ